MPVMGPSDSEECGNPNGCNHRYDEHKFGDESKILTRQEESDIENRFSIDGKGINYAPGKFFEMRDAIEAERNKRRLMPCTKCDCGWFYW